MKAQISLEYYFSIVLFVMFIAYVVFQLLAIIPLYTREMKSELLMSEAYQISELLVNDVGYPPNWSTVTLAKRIGLANRTNVTNLVSVVRINALNKSCETASGYANISLKLGLDPTYQFNITIKDMNDGRVLMLCYPKPLIIKRDLVKTVTRIAATDTGSYVTITITLW